MTTGTQKRHDLGARRYWLIWIPIVPVALWALVRVLGFERGFPLVPLMAFTPYAMAAALLVAGVAVALRNWAAAAVAGLATLCLLAAVLPRAVGDGTAEAAGRQTLKVLSANVYFGKAEAEALVALVDRHRVDLLAVQELTPGFARELHRAGIDRRLPYAIEETRPAVTAAGGGLYSRLPLRKLGSGTSYFRQPRAILRMPGGSRLRVVDIHPFPPSRAGAVDTWSETLESLPSAGSGVPWVLAGDFNATLDHSELRDLLDRGYRDAGDVAGEGLEPTWPNDGSLGPLITIDHVLADRRLDVVDYAVEEMPGSDHRPVFAELALPRATATGR